MGKRTQRQIAKIAYRFRNTKYKQRPAIGITMARAIAAARVIAFKRKAATRPKNKKCARAVAAADSNRKTVAIANLE